VLAESFRNLLYAPSVAPGDQLLQVANARDELVRGHVHDGHRRLEKMVHLITWNEHRCSPPPKKDKKKTRDISNILHLQRSLDLRGGQNAATVTPHDKQALCCRCLSMISAAYGTFADKSK